MNVKHIASILLLFSSFTIFSQEKLYTSATIPDNLIQNANAVVRENSVNIILKSSSEMHVTTKRIITVLNKKGNDNVGAYVHYDNNDRIKDLQVLVYNAFGSQIKKVKKNDFKDVSAVDGGTLYSDSRVKYLEYTPIDYPYTIEFICEKVNSNTAFIQSFYPVNNYFLSVENSAYSISYPSGINIRTKEKNFEKVDLEKEELDNEISYKVENLEAIKPEDYSPSFSVMAPRVLVTSNQFTLEGVKTQVEDWNDFGKWMYHDLIKDTQDLPAGTRSIIENLVEGETDDIEKAKKVYQYVQDKVRYISVQVGIGGWKPFNVSKVDRLGYGDCKALTNYTMALLKAAGVESHYTVVYAKSSQRSLEKDFAAMQGNHVILNIPQENAEDIWLECTSQKFPFGFIGDFTDDRDVLVITPEGGKIVHTKKYDVEENLQTIHGICNISNEGAIEAKVKVVSKGIQYDSKYGLAFVTDRDLDSEYKERWRYINGLNIEEMAIKNDRDNIEFIEDIGFNASNYSKVIGERMLVPLNALNRSRHVPDRYRNRKLPLQVKRGFKDVDVVEIKLPSDYKIESQPQNISMENKFGSYKMELEVKDENTLIYNREFIIKDGDFPKEDYSGFRDFYKEVSKKDNAKIALIKK
ncbi:DUF3857 domain-containing transglutaminase family protein [Seonamhaeicola maritimus]|uniref:DUF3857 domain-containing protein n=1 Tax=Seonamhaeicola maritimus TaxID=2591822 RepID=A0A5C7GJR8_9FLAO|nr:DUF3857 domain-containing transglutaminase family protein [Seonamhaeicola maritimus]TXG38560.1 DUF3857 domain-containing protein [Seonamhaeicola maritimus]